MEVKNTYLTKETLLLISLKEAEAKQIRNKTIKYFWYMIISFILAGLGIYVLLPAELVAIFIIATIIFGLWLAISNREWENLRREIKQLKNN